VIIQDARQPAGPDGVGGPPRAALTAQRLDLAYRGRRVVHDACLELVAGEVLALVGPNGSGKSTLLRALCRLHVPSAGSIRLGDGADALALSATQFARSVTLLAQSRPTPTGVSVRDVVGYGRHPHRGRWRGKDAAGAAAVAHAMAVTGVAEMADRSVEQLSGGELQRVWFATCLAQQTGVLLLDEPTNHLDLRYQVETLDLIRELADDHGIAVGVVLHDIDHAAAVADRVALLHAGRVRACGRPAEVLTSALLSEVYAIGVQVVAAADGTVTTHAVGSRSRCRPGQAREEPVPTAR
jgi:iron complex transport system ATP-binding protein